MILSLIVHGSFQAVGRLSFAVGFSPAIVQEASGVSTLGLVAAGLGGERGGRLLSGAVFG